MAMPRGIDKSRWERRVRADRYSTWRRSSRALKGNATDGITINDDARTRAARNSNRSAHLSGMFMSRAYIPAAIHSSLQQPNPLGLTRTFSISANTIQYYILCLWFFHDFWIKKKYVQSFRCCNLFSLKVMFSLYKFLFYLWLARIDLLSLFILVKSSRSSFT